MDKKIKQEAERLFEMKPEAKKVFIASDGNSFFNESDAINHKRTSKNEFVVVEKTEIEEDSNKTTKEKEAANKTEEDKAIEIIDKMKGMDEKKIIAALKEAKISQEIINLLMHKL